MTDDHPPSEDDVEDGATERQHARAERVERIVEAFETRFDDRSYPVSSTELGAEYADLAHGAGGSPPHASMSA